MNIGGFSGHWHGLTPTHLSICRIHLKKSLYKSKESLWYLCTISCICCLFQKLFGVSFLLWNRKGVFPPRRWRCGFCPAHPATTTTTTVFWERNLPCVHEKSQRGIWGLRSCDRMRASQLVVLTLCLHFTPCTSAQVRSFDFVSFYWISSSLEATILVKSLTLFKSRITKWTCRSCATNDSSIYFVDSVVFQFYFTPKKKKDKI